MEQRSIASSQDRLKALRRLPSEDGKPSIDWTATRARIGGAGAILSVDVSAMLIMSDEELNQGPHAEIVKLHEAGLSLDWVYGGSLDALERSWAARHGAAGRDMA